MPASQRLVRAAVPADMEQVAAIFAHYVATSVTTFEEVPPMAAAWRRRLDELTGRNLPFLEALLACEEQAGRADPYRGVAALLHLIARRRG